MSRFSNIFESDPFVSGAGGLLLESGGSSTISALPLAGPITGTELSPFVQGGVNVQADFNTLAAFFAAAGLLFYDETAVPPAVSPFASGTGSVAIGDGAAASGTQSRAFGFNSTADGAYSVVPGGLANLALATLSFVMGNTNVVNNTSDGSIILGGVNTSITNSLDSLSISGNVDLIIDSTKALLGMTNVAVLDTVVNTALMVAGNSTISNSQEVFVGQIQDSFIDSSDGTGVLSASNVSITGSNDCIVVGGNLVTMTDSILCFNGTGSNNDYGTPGFGGTGNASITGNLVTFDAAASECGVFTGSDVMFGAGVLRSISLSGSAHVFALSSNDNTNLCGSGNTFNGAYSVGAGTAVNLDGTYNYGLGQGIDILLSDYCLGGGQSVAIDGDYNIGWGGGISIGQTTPSSSVAAFGQNHIIDGNNNLVAGHTCNVIGENNVVGGGTQIVGSSGTAGWNGVFGELQTLDEGNRNLIAGRSHVLGGQTSLQFSAIFGDTHFVDGQTSLVFGITNNGGQNAPNSFFGNLLGGGTTDLDGAFNIVVGGTLSVGQTTLSNFNVIGGGESTYDGNYGRMTGRGHIVDGDYTDTSGREHSVTADYASAKGYQAAATLYGQKSHASGMFAIKGDAQASNLTSRLQTPDDVLTEAFLDGVSLQILLPVDSTRTFITEVVAMRVDSPSMWGSWIIKGSISNIGGTTTILNQNTEVIYEASATSFPSAAADDTTDALALFATGSAGRTINWVYSTRLVETGI